MKPSSKKTPKVTPRKQAPRRRKPRAVTPATATTAEPPASPAPPPAAPAAPAGPAEMFDSEEAVQAAPIVESAAQGGEDQAGAAAETGQNEQVDADPPVDEPDPAQPEVPEDETEDERTLREFDAGEPLPQEPASDASGRVRMGAIEGALYRISTEVLLQILGREALDRIDHMREHPSIQLIQKRMRATDGRCAPVYMTEAEGELPRLFAGIESVVCAMDIGLSEISVVTIAPEDAGALQGWLAAEAVKAAERAKVSDDDEELIFSAYSS